jgi:hypothetical protein
MYSIHPDYIKYSDFDPARTCETRFSLVAQKKGRIDPFFMEGGSIKCDMKIFHDAEILY